MEYDCHAVVRDADGRPLEALKAAFIANGFQVSPSGRGEFLARGPGMRSTSQNPLFGVSEARVRAIGSQLEIHANLGGAQWMARFVLFFPPLLGVFLAIVLAAVFGATGQIQALWFAPLIVAGAEAPWIVVGPLMARWIRRRTEKALDALLRSVSAADVGSLHT